MLVGALVAQPGKNTFTGSITDSECATGDHSHMRMGPTDAECTKACVEIHGAQYVLWDGKDGRRSVPLDLNARRPASNTDRFRSCAHPRIDSAVRRECPVSRADPAALQVDSVRCASSRSARPLPYVVVVCVNLHGFARAAGSSSSPAIFCAGARWICVRR